MRGRSNSSTDPVTLLERLKQSQGRVDQQKLDLALKMVSQMCGKSKTDIKPTDLANKLKVAANRLGLSRDSREDFAVEYRHKENGHEKVYYARQNTSNIFQEAAARFLWWAHYLDKREEEQKKAIEAIVSTLKEVPRAQIQAACGTGKTHIAMRATERLLSDYDEKAIIVVVEPTCTLIAQVLKQWYRYSENRDRYRVKTVFSKAHDTTDDHDPENGES